MKTKKSILVNYIYTVFYQIVALIVPLITTPYLARILGASESGKYSYTNSIASFFAIFAYLGFGLYAQRSIAKHQDSIHQQSIEFWNCFIGRLLPSLFSIFIYIFLVAFGPFDVKYHTLFWIQTLNILAVVFDASYFYQGNEMFKELSIRNFIIKVLTTISIFAFVRTQNDINIFVFIQSLSLIISDLPLWPYILRKLDKIKLRELSPLSVIKPAFLLFLPTIASTLYTSVDKFLIGYITQEDAQNGNYEYADRFIKLCLTVINSLGTVLIARNSQDYAKGDRDAVKNTIFFYSRYALGIAIPMCFGLIAVSTLFIPLYLGEGYTQSSYILQVLAPLIIIMCLTNIIGQWFLIPSGRDKQYTISIVSGAMINIVLNCILIYFLGAYGAAISTLVSEFCIFLIMSFYVRKDINVLKILLNSWKYVLSAIVMFFCCYCLRYVLDDNLVSFCIICFSGLIIYVLLLLLLKDEALLMSIKFLSNKLRRKQ